MSVTNPSPHLVTMSRSQVVETLLKFGVEKDTSTREGATPLHVASLQGHAEVVRSLLQVGVIGRSQRF